MKANRKFVQADDAVSPVIAVILMVAITVVLAATVFVLLQGINTGSSAPKVGFSADESTDKLTVNQAPSGSNWNRLSVKVSSCTQVGGANQESMVINMGTATPFQNDPAIAGGGDLNSAATGTACGAGLSVAVTATADPVDPSDSLSFCAGPTTLTSRPTQVKVQISDTQASELIFEHTFVDVAVCTA